jgi:UDP-N-acetylglucosamine 2-epimerase (non-hydrolysing)
MVVVVGDVNSSLGCALVAAKAGIPVAHVEAGLRSEDRSMPEEINRVVIDSISSLLLTHSPDADENLLREGHSPDSIHRVGNLMIDSLVQSLPRRQPAPLPAEVHRYAVLTLHRPSNVDDLATFRGLLAACAEIAERKAVHLVLPVHPRVERQLAQVHLTPRQRSRLISLPPLPYLRFLSLLVDCEFVLTDSGGIQEESTYLGKPCFTLRDNTERPITVSRGTNYLVGTEPEAIRHRVLDALASGPRSGIRIDGWDGHSARRAAGSMVGYLAGNGARALEVATRH